MVWQDNCCISTKNLIVSGAIAIDTLLTVLHGANLALDKKGQIRVQ